MFTFSQTAIGSVFRDIQAGNTEYVDQFFASRSDWLDQDDKANQQTDNQQEEKQQEAAQA
jgi:hypothetical protein